MNFQNLEYFTAVVQEGGITRAAERLGISQQALSNQISRMEQELGCSLFNRKHGFELTYSGKYFYDSAARILNINRETETVLNDINLNKKGELKIGISHTRGQVILPFLLPEFHKMHPYVSLSLTEGTTQELEDQLAKGNVDVVISFKPFLLETVESIDLMHDRFKLIVPYSLLKKHFGDSYPSVIAKNEKSPDITIFKDIPFVLLSREDHIRRAVDHEFYIHRISPEIILETGNQQTAFALAAEGLGATVCPELYLNSPYINAGNPDSRIRKNVAVLRFSSGRVKDIIAIGYNSERYLSNLAKDFISLAEKKFKTVFSK